MEILLDTNFILECVKRKIDMADIDGSLIIPEGVISELKKIAEKGSFKDKTNAKIALEIIKKNKEKFRIVEIGKSFVDAGIKRCAGRNTAVATIDKKLKRELKGRAKILMIKAGKKLEIV